MDIDERPSFELRMSPKILRLHGACLTNFDSPRNENEITAANKAVSSFGSNPSAPTSPIVPYVNITSPR
jgi:hypothetical protein